MTAYVKPTLSDLKQSLADRHNSGSIPTKSATLTLWTRLFNRACAYCIRKLKITKHTTLTPVNGTIVLPDDFVEITSVSLDGLEQLQISQQESEFTNGQVYWISGDFVTGFYFNAPTDSNYDIYYVYNPSPMVNDSDTCPFPDEEAIVAYAYGMIRSSESDPFQDSGKALAECDSRLREIQSNQNTNEAGYGFNLVSGS